MNPIAAHVQWAAFFYPRTSRNAPLVFDDNSRERVKSSTSAKGAGTFYMDTNQKPRLVAATTEANGVVFMKLGEDGKPVEE